MSSDVASATNALPMSGPGVPPVSPAPSPAASFTEASRAHPIPRFETEDLPLSVRHRAISPAEYASRLRGSAIPIVIDLGSSECRAGFADEPEPRVIIPTAIALTRGKGVTPQFLLVGRFIGDIDPSRSKFKSPFDGSAVNGINWLEMIFDYIFEALGLSGCSRVDHPIILTECYNNPAFSRAITNELLFGAYGVPAVCYVVDALSAWFYNTAVLPPLYGPAHIAGDDARRLETAAAAAADAESDSDVIHASKRSRLASAFDSAAANTAATDSAGAAAADSQPQPLMTFPRCPYAPPPSALVLSLSHSALHVLPVARHRIRGDAAARVPLGASSLQAFLAGALELSTGNGRTVGTVPRARWLLESGLCAVAPTAEAYATEMRRVVAVCEPLWREAAAEAVTAVTTGGVAVSSVAIDAVSPNASASTTGTTAAPASAAAPDATAGAATPAEGSSSASPAAAAANESDRAHSGATAVASESQQRALALANATVGLLDKLSALSSESAGNAGSASSSATAAAPTTTVHMCVRRSDLLPLTASLSAHGPLLGPLALVARGGAAAAALAQSSALSTEAAMASAAERKQQSSLRFRRMLHTKRVAKMRALRAELAAFEALQAALARGDATPEAAAAEAAAAGYAAPRDMAAADVIAGVLIEIRRNLTAAETSVAQHARALREQGVALGDDDDGGDVGDAARDGDVDADADVAEGADGAADDDASAATTAAAGAGASATANAVPVGFTGFSQEEIAAKFPLLLVPDDQLDEEGLKAKKSQRFVKACSEGRMRKQAEKAAAAAVATAAAAAGSAAGGDASAGAAIPAPSGYFERLTVLTVQASAATVLGSTDGLLRHRAELVSALAQFNMNWTLPPNLPAVTTFVPPTFAGAGVMAAAKAAAAAPVTGVWASAVPTARAAVSAVRALDAVLWELWRADPKLLPPVPLPAVVSLAAATSTTAAAAAARAAAMGDESSFADTVIARPFESGRPGAVVAAAMGLPPTHLLVWPERLRAPEALFSPWIVGASHVGLTEAVRRALRRLPAAVATAVARSVFLTGGLASLPFLALRVGNELRGCAALSAAGAGARGNSGVEDADQKAVSHVVVRARDPVLDAWKGARELAWLGVQQDADRFRREWCLTAEEWAGKPVHALKENPLGNAFVDIVNGLNVTSTSAMADD